MVPLVVIVPPLRPVPAVIDATVPGGVQDGTPDAFSTSICVPVKLPANVTHAVPFQYMMSPARVVDGKIADGTQDGVPDAFSDSTCVPLLLPGSVSHDVPL
jgi:hypothetical protein